MNYSCYLRLPSNTVQPARLDRRLLPRRMLPVIDCGFFHQLTCDAGLHGQAVLCIPVTSARASLSSVMQSTSQRNFSAWHRTATLPRDSATLCNSAGNVSNGANRSREILYVATVSGNFRPERGSREIIERFVRRIDD